MNRNKSGRGRFFLTYTLLYCILALGVFGWFALAGKSMINSSDAYEQHINALIAYGKWIRGILYHLVHDHSLTPENYSFGIGYGADFFTSMHYYAIGDPLNLPVAFLPSAGVYYYYQFLMVLRPYLAGLAFWHMAGLVKKTASDTALLTGCLSYAFCGVVLFIGMWNPFFVNALILMPLYVTGAEKILRGKGCVCFTLTVALSALTNFYFFYMQVILIICYVAVRLLGIFLPSRKNGKDGGQPAKASAIFGLLMKFILSGLVGVMISAVILLPVVLKFLGNPRGGQGHVFHALYPAAYYKELLANLISYLYHPQFDTELGFTFLALPALLLLLTGLRRDRFHAQLGALTGISLIMMIFPVFGFVMTGMAYMGNRWTFAACLLVAFLITDAVDEAFCQSGRRRNIFMGLSLVMILVYGISFLILKESVRTQILLLVPALIIILVGSLQTGKRAGEAKADPASGKGGLLWKNILLVLTMAGILFNGFYANAPSQGDLPGGYEDASGGSAFLTAFQANEIPGMLQTAGIDNNTFFRYSGRDLAWNGSLSYGVSSSQFYWSLANGVVSDYFKEMAVNEMADFSYRGLDDRASLLTLAGTRYYSLRFDNAGERAYVPAAYTESGNYYNFTYFENTLALPLGYTYTRQIPEAVYEEMTPIERQEALLQGVVTKGDTLEIAPLSRDEIRLSAEEIPFEVTTGDGLVRDADGFHVFLPGAAATLQFVGLPRSETYVYLKGLAFDGASDMVNLQLTQILEDGSNGVGKTLSYKQATSQFYSGFHNYLVNLDFHQDALSTITITFPETGDYTLEDLKVYCQDAQPYMEEALARKTAPSLQNVSLHQNPVSNTTGEITGTIDSPEDCALLLAIPYEKGWTATVDGTRTDLVQANTMFMALPLEAGSHEIRLTYTTPGLIPGTLISILGIVLVLILARKKV